MDSIANLITSIKNASAVGKETVVVPYSRMKESILAILEKEGYVKSVAKKGKKLSKTLEVTLVYDDYGSRIKGIERMSKLSKRSYSGAQDLKPVKQGHGVMVLTTSKGIMTDAMARKEKVGGELLFKVW